MSSRKKVLKIILISIFILSGFIGSVSESTYDMSFAKTALDISDSVTAIGWIYFAGYLTEAVASATLGSKIDAIGPIKAVIIFTSLASLLLITAGLSNLIFGVTSIILIVLLAGAIDFINQLVGIAHESALPEVFGDDERSLIQFSGLDSSVRSISSIAAPVISGAIIFDFPGFKSLIIVGILYGLSYTLLVFFLSTVKNQQMGVTIGQQAHLTEKSEHNQQEKLDGTLEEKPAESTSLPNGFQQTLSYILRSPSWRYFLVIDTLATVAISTVLLLLFALLVHEFTLDTSSAGLVLGAMALGSFIAAFFIGKSTKDTISKLFGIGCFITGLGGAIIALSYGTLSIAMVGAFILGFGSVFQLRGMTLLIQLNAPQGKIAAWFSVIDTVELIFNAITIIIAAYIMDKFGGTPVFLVVAIISILCSIAWLAIKNTYHFTTAAQQQ
ncbi:MFS transporter [Rothia sp. CCM 9419]|uniref:MFS transporter n=1 Tax=Rothia sp. CCM 9419 TaxID=3402662 RepID=UPI003AEBA1F2